jgi:uncharacterized protein
MRLVSRHGFRPGFLWLVAVLALLVAPFTAQAQSQPHFPAFTGYVVDDANILSQATRAQLTQTLGDFQRTSHKQVVVATIKTLQGTPIEDYGYQLGRAWGVGEKGKDSGAILLVAPAERQVRIEVGYGLEGDLTDAISKQIIEQIILPAFRTGDFNRGVLGGTVAVLTTLGAKNISLAPGQQPSQVQNFVQTTRNDPGQLWSFLIPLFIFGVFAFLRAHSYGGRSYGAPIIMNRGFGGGFGGGGFSGGGGSFGGGGGGSFGGGGASGGW